VSIESSVWVACSRCGDEANTAMCRGCAQSTAPGSVRDWLDRERLKPGTLSPDVIAAFERCIEDLEVS
jgi:hypothetical protein